MRFIAAFLIVFIAAGLAAEEPTPENSDLQIRLLVDHSLPAPEALRERMLTGQNLQALAVIQSGENGSGRLLDPDSFSANWGDTPLPTFVYYKNPATALVFALPDISIIANEPESELSMTAKLIGDEEISAGWRLPISLTKEDVDTIRDRQKNMAGRTVLVTDSETGNPIKGAWVFGQRRGDLVTRSRDDGRALLTAPTRNAAGPHYAWADNYWTTDFDPVSSRTVPLIPMGDSLFETEVTIKSPTGEVVDEAVLFIGNRSYAIAQSGVATVTFPRSVESPVALVLVANNLPQNFTLTHSPQQELTLAPAEEVNESLRRRSREGLEYTP